MSFSVHYYIVHTYLHVLAKARVRKGSVSRRRPTTGADSSPVVATNERMEFPTPNRESNSVLPSYLEVVQRDQREKEKISSEGKPSYICLGLSRLLSV